MDILSPQWWNFYIRLQGPGGPGGKWGAHPMAGKVAVAGVIEISSTGCCATPPAAFRSTSPQFARWSPIWVHDGLSSGSGIRAQKKVPLACCPWFCASATGEWISFAIFANAPLNGYTLPTNPITKLTELLQRLQASFVPPQARFHVFPWPRRRS